MPLELDDYDISILKSLLKDDANHLEKSHVRQELLLQLLRRDLIDLSTSDGGKPGLDKNAEVSSVIQQQKHKHDNQVLEVQRTNSNIKKGMKIKLDCDFCHGPILSDPYIFKFANFERFFCCTACMAGYKTKYAGRIDSIKRRFEEGEKIPNSANPLEV